MSKIALSGNASGTGTFTFAAPGTNTDRTLTLPDASGTLATTADIPSVNPFTLGTAVASTSGTAIDFTGIPSWAKRVTVMLSGVSLTGAVAFLIQIGDSGGIEDTGYIGASVGTSAASTVSSYDSASSGFRIGTIGASDILYASLTLVQLTGNTWMISGTCYVDASTDFVRYVSGSKTLTGTLDRVRVFGGGVETFDAGTINISYEG